MSKRFYALDVLKIVATILIIFHHYQQVTGASFKYINFWGGQFYWGYIVELFFVLSGYFTFHYVDKIKQGLCFKKYMYRRVTRLLPLVAIAAVTYEILLYTYQTVCGKSWFDIKVTIWGTIIAALGIQDSWGLSDLSVNNPTWYISILLLCYIFFFVIVYVSKATKIPYYYFFVAMIFVGTSALTYNLDLPLLSYHSGRGYYAFFFGTILGMICNKTSMVGSKKVQWCSLGILILFIWLIGFQYSLVSVGINYIVTFVLYPALIILCHSEMVKKIFCFKLIGTVGAISYDVYIWHNVLFLAMYISIELLGISVNLNQLKCMIVYTIICFIVGVFSYYILERPIQKHIIERWDAKLFKSN